MRVHQIISAAVLSCCCAATGADAQSLDRYGLPACDSEQVIKLLKEAIASGPDGRIGGITVYTVIDVRHVGYTTGIETMTSTGSSVRVVDANDPVQRKTCFTSALTSHGQRHLDYRFQWQTLSNSVLWLEAKVLP